MPGTDMGGLSRVEAARIKAENERKNEALGERIRESVNGDGEPSDAVRRANTPTVIERAMSVLKARAKNDSEAAFVQAKEEKAARQEALEEAVADSLACNEEEERLETALETAKDSGDRDEIVRLTRALQEQRNESEIAANIVEAMERSLDSALDAQHRAHLSAIERAWESLEPDDRVQRFHEDIGHHHARVDFLEQVQRLSAVSSGYYLEAPISRMRLSNFRGGAWFVDNENSRAVHHLPALGSPSGE